MLKRTTRPELDGDRLVWAMHGKLFCGNIASQGITDEAELFNFNGMAFQRIQAPY